MITIIIVCVVAWCLLGLTGVILYVKQRKENILVEDISSILLTSLLGLIVYTVWIKEWYDWNKDKIIINFNKKD